ncbi:neuronal acetylcholine receptor subunit alpha-3-like [Panulirus ornatus]|uniref:neuronal acetylcholine receptor subunit alpha-3-like n=1 Tax=Panulirus ornatus TaxID=150431 RepID=UPI003A88C7EE
MRQFVVVAALLQLVHVAVGNGDQVTVDVSALRASLLKGYDRMVLPSMTTTVNISDVQIVSLELHEAEHSIHVYSWLSHSWTDPRLVWADEDHPGLDYVGMDPQEIWRPDLTLYNAADMDSYVIKPKTSALVYPSGQVLYVPPFKLHFKCLMDLTYWPHDAHKCVLKIGSWIYHGKKIDLRVTGDAPKFKFDETLLPSAVNSSTSKWVVQEATMILEEKTYPCCTEVYPSALISVVVRRNASAHMWTVKIPVVCLTLLTLVLFLLPPDAGEKVTLGGLCLTLNMLFIAYTNHVVSYAPTHAPLIVQMVSQQLLVVAVMIVVEALVLRMARSPHFSPLPTLLREPALAASSILCLSNYKDAVTSLKKDDALAGGSEEVELEEGSRGDLLRRGSRHHSEWLLLAAVLDRLAFFLCLTICIVILIRFSSIL